MSKKSKIVFANNLADRGGPSEFMQKLKSYLLKHNYYVCHGRVDQNTKAFIVTSSTKRIDRLIYCKIKKVKIILRLDGIWYFSVRRSNGLLKYLYFKSVNLLMSIIRRYFADVIIYQSKFVEEWWNSCYGNVSKRSLVIYNGCKIPDIKFKEKLVSKRIKIVCIEGNLVNDKNTIKLISKMIDCLNSNKFDNISIYGNSNKKLKDHFINDKRVVFHDHVTKSELEEVRKQKTLHLALDLNSACSNSVIESMSFGNPVLALNTGSLSEIVKNSGILIDVKGSTFKDEVIFNDKQFYDAVNDLVINYETYSKSAYFRARDIFSLDTMGQNYLNVILN